MKRKGKKQLESSKTRMKLLVFVLDYLESDIGDFYPPPFPTLHEMADGAGVSSTNSASHHVNSLIEEGLLASVDRGYRRTFGITKAGLKLAKELRHGQSTDSGATDDTGRDSNDGLDLPKGAKLGGGAGGAGTEAAAGGEDGADNESAA